MRTVCIASIVEGHGEVEALPILIRRLAAEIEPGAHVVTPRPLRITKSKLLMAGELERAVKLAASRILPPGGLLVLLDSDADCPAHLGPRLVERVARPDFPVAVVLAKSEFEAWFIAAAVSLRSKRGLRSDIIAPQEPEAIQGAKEWLDERMMPGRKYAETLDQPALTALFDLEPARRLRSFDKMWRSIEYLLARAVEEPQP